MVKSGAVRKSYHDVAASNAVLVGETLETAGCGVGGMGDWAYCDLEHKLASILLRPQGIENGWRGREADRTSALLRAR
jgi:hypothetical protein